MRRGYTQEDAARMLLVALRHPHDPKLIADVEEMIQRAEDEPEDSERGRRFRDVVLVIEATTLAASTH